MIPETKKVEPLVTPFTILIDTREQLPFAFEGLKADAKDDSRPLIVKTKVAGLKTGDYAIENYEDEIAIERKSFDDLFSSLGNGRQRFERELGRLNEMKFAAVVCENSWRDVAFHQPVHSKMSSKAVCRSIFAYSQRFVRVHWFLMPDRRMAEACCYQLLRRFWIDKEAGK